MGKLQHLRGYKRVQRLPSERAGSLDCPRSGLRTGAEMQRLLVNDTGRFINSHIRKKERKGEEIVCTVTYINLAGS